MEILSNPILSQMSTGPDKNIWSILPETNVFLTWILFFKFTHFFVEFCRDRRLRAFVKILAKNLFSHPCLGQNLSSTPGRNAVTLISFDYFGEQIWNSVTIPFSTFTAFLHYCIFSRSGVGLQFWWWAQLWVWCRRWACVHKVRCPCWICKTALIAIYCRSFDEDANRHGVAYARYSMVEHTHCPSAVHYVGDKIFSAEAIETISPKP